MTVNWLRALPFTALSAVIIANVLGNIFMKLGSSVDAKYAHIFGLFGWQTLLGIGFFASGVFFYGFALKLLPLYMVQSVVILQFIGAIIAAVIVFGEAIVIQQWLGIAFIIIGLALVTRYAS